MVYDKINELVKDIKKWNYSTDFNMGKKIKELDEISDGGLYLPETAREKGAQSLIAEVLEVARAIDDDTHEETNISGIPQGALVLIEKKAGIPVPWDEGLRIVETKEVLAIVEELNVI